MVPSWPWVWKGSVEQGVQVDSQRKGTNGTHDWPRFGKGEDFLKQVGNRRDPQMNPSIVRSRARVWGCSVRKHVNELTHGQEFRTRSTSSKGDTKSGLDMERKSRPRV